MNMLAQTARFSRAGRLALWTVVALAVTVLWYSLGISRFLGRAPHILPIALPAAICLLLAWALGLLGVRSSWPVRVAIVLITVTLPYIILFVLLMGFCPLTNTIAGGYRCGL